MRLSQMVRPVADANRRKAVDYAALGSAKVGAMATLLPRLGTWGLAQHPFNDRL